MKIKLLVITILISNYTIVLATPNVDLINNLNNNPKNKNQSENKLYNEVEIEILKNLKNMGVENFQGTIPNISNKLFKKIELELEIPKQKIIDYLSNKILLKQDITLNKVDDFIGLKQYTTNDLNKINYDKIHQFVKDLNNH